MNSVQKQMCLGSILLAASLITQGLAFAETEQPKIAQENTQAVDAQDSATKELPNTEVKAEAEVKKYNKHDILKTMFLGRRPYMQ